MVITGPERFLTETSSALAVLVIATVFAHICYLTLRVLNVPGWRSLGVSSAVTVIFWNWPTAAFGSISSGLAVSSLLAPTVLAAWFFSESRRLQVTVFAVAASSAMFLGSMALAERLMSAQSIAFEDQHEGLQVEDSPNVILVVVDGYPRSDVLREQAGYDNSEFESFLEDEGFFVVDRSRSNYSTTHLSLASMMNMDLVTPRGGEIGHADLEVLAEATSGENEVVHFFQNAGYQYVHSPIPYWFSQCAPNVDVCLSKPPLDFTTYGLLYRTPLGHFFHRPQNNPATILNADRIAMLASWSQHAKSREWHVPFFAFIHLILPHPPLFLNSNCVPAGVGFDIHRLHDVDETAGNSRSIKSAWLDQIECTNKALSALITGAHEDDLIIITSDHGPDFLYRPPIERLSHEQLKERFSTFTALRIPHRCKATLVDDLDLVNLFDVVIACLSGEGQTPVRGRYFASDDLGRFVEYEHPDNAPPRGLSGNDLNSRK